MSIKAARSAVSIPMLRPGRFFVGWSAPGPSLWHSYRVGMKRLRTRVTLSAAEARRLALAAQGFAAPRPELTADWRGLRRRVKPLGLLPIDSGNALLRAPYPARLSTPRRGARRPVA